MILQLNFAYHAVNLQVEDINLNPKRSGMKAPAAPELPSQKMQIYFFLGDNINITWFLSLSYSLVIDHKQ